MTKTPTYETFMLDHVTGNLSSAMSLAGNLHLLLSDQGAETYDVWRRTADVMVQSSESMNSHIDDACEILSCANENVRWRRGLSGAQYAKIGPNGGKLMRLLPGKSVPTHGHKALEVTVVLEGQLSDGEFLFQPGDIVFGEPGVRHKPAASGNQACVCYVAKK